MTKDLNNNASVADDRSTLVANGTNSGSTEIDIEVHDEPAPARTYPDDFVPSSVDVKSELWRIATGEGSESSRVSALRVIADIMGLMRPTSSEFPEGMSALLDAIARGLDSSKKE